MPPPGFSLGQQINPYHVYELSVQYKFDSGILDAPIAYVQGGLSSDQTMEPVNVTKRQGRKILTFSFVRQGDRPQVPDPTAVGSDEVLLSVDVVLTDPKPDAVGANYLFGAKGVFIYALKTPPSYSQMQYPLGKMEQGDRQPVGDLATGGFEG